MDQLDEMIRHLICQYAAFHPEKNSYQAIVYLNEQQKQEIEAQLITIFSHYLSREGINEQKICQNRKQLRKIFHPDSLKNGAPEYIWLERILGDDNEASGFCFKLVDLCADKLLQKPQFKGQYDGYVNLEELLQKLMQHNLSAPTRTQRALIKMVIHMLQLSQEYFHLTSKLKNPFLQTCCQMMPFISSAYCMSFFLEEIALMYGVGFLVAKGGIWLEKSPVPFIKLIGKNAKIMGQMLSNSLSLLLASLVKLNLFSYLGVYSLGIDLGMSFYYRLQEKLHKNKNINNPHHEAFFPSGLSGHKSSNSKEFFSDSMELLSPQDFVGSRAIKWIATLFEILIYDQQQQWFWERRLGKEKSEVLQKFLIALNKVYETQGSQREKLWQIGNLLEQLGAIEWVNAKGSKTAETISTAKEMWGYFCEQNKLEDQQPLLLTL